MRANDELSANGNKDAEWSNNTQSVPGIAAVQPSVHGLTAAVATTRAFRLLMVPERAPPTMKYLRKTTRRVTWGLQRTERRYTTGAFCSCELRIPQAMLQA
jgi:hypothetical protein